MIGTQAIQLPLKLFQLENSLLTCNINSKYKSKNLENPISLLFKDYKPAQDLMTSIVIY